MSSMKVTGLLDCVETRGASRTFLVGAIISVGRTDKNSIISAPIEMITAKHKIALIHPFCTPVLNRARS